MAGNDQGGAGVGVYSGTDAAQSYFQGVCCDLPVPCGMSLIHDHPWGYALVRLPTVARPMLVLTECPYYLRDLRALAPEGLVVLSRPVDDLAGWLFRVATGERFYHGPVLGPSPLTERERMVFRLLACSTSHDVVAAQLGISARTVHNYAVAVRGKLVFATAIVLQVFLV